MSKSKDLSVIADVSPQKTAVYHQEAHLHLAIGAAYAVLCGVELQRIQAELPKSATRCTFEEWLKKHKEELGFERRIAFAYKAVAEHVKSRMLVNGDMDVVLLLSRHPASLNDHESKLILKAVNKAVDGQSLRELMVEMKIARGDFGEALGKKNSALADTAKAKDAPAPTPELLIQDELFLPICGGGDGSLPTIWEPFDKLVKAWNKPLKDGGMKAPLWQFTDDKKKRELLHHLKTGRAVTVRKLDAMIAQIEESLK